MKNFSRQSAPKKKQKPKPPNLGYNPKYIAVLRTPRSVQALSGKQKKKATIMRSFIQKNPNCSADGGTPQRKGILLIFRG